MAFKLIYFRYQFFPWKNVCTVLIVNIMFCGFKVIFSF